MKAERSLQAADGGSTTFQLLQPGPLAGKLADQVFQQRAGGFGLPLQHQAIGIASRKLHTFAKWFRLPADGDTDLKPVLRIVIGCGPGRRA